MTPQADKEAHGVLAAVAAGATICSIQFLLMTGGLAGADASVSAGLWIGLLAFVISWVAAAFGFAVGILLIGLPVLAALARFGRMSRGAAGSSGALLAALFGWGAGAWAFGLSDALPPAVFLLAPGAAAGLALHRVACEKDGTPA
jgi:hypothetical protein